MEAAVRAVIDAWNARDAPALLARVTDAYVIDELEFPTRQEAEQGLPQVIGQEPLTLGGLASTEVSDASASTEGTLFLGTSGTPQRFRLIRDHGVWKVDASEQRTGPIPSGVTAVDLVLTEYTFHFDERAITSGGLAFNVVNNGEVQHEVRLANVPEGLDLEEAARAEEEPAGVEPLGGTLGPVDPGAGTTILFIEPLGPGRYAMFCFVETADGTPHAELGMIAEFTVE